MGEITEKTYRAPDGSVFRIETDGSVTKIKSGKPVSNEQFSRYKVTPDGKIFRVENDGSITFLGNAEDKENNTYSQSKKVYFWMLISIIVILILVVAIYNNQSSYNVEIYAEPVKVADEVVIESGENNLHSGNSSITETPVSEKDRYAFICDGQFYGKIGNSDIHGYFNLPTDAPDGWYYYDSQGSENKIKLTGTSDGKQWLEYVYDSNSDGWIVTGTWAFNYWNDAYHNFATGVYTRASDNRQFPIVLYKLNFK